ncbi:MAG: 1-aminocyclopropane-1-carboxylate deaminase/D-cysteine desulfhydrase [Pseudomonadales bacterium]
MSNSPRLESLNNFQFHQSPQIQRVEHKLLKQRSVELSVLRLDALDQYLGGNKWFKLQAYLRDARSLGYTRLLSFGGAWSNHLYALAAAGKRFGFSTLGIVRGERPTNLNPLLTDLQGMGMQLVFVSRSEYRRRGDVAYVDQLRAQFSPCYVIPEGGASALGVQGAANMLPVSLRNAYDVFALACGSGTSAAGLISVLPGSAQVCGFSVMKDRGTLQQAVTTMVPNAQASWCIESRFAGAGFARASSELVQFMDAFSASTGIPLEPVYTGKLFMGLFTMIVQGDFATGTRLLALHTGGLQGLRGMQTVLIKLRAGMS